MSESESKSVEFATRYLVTGEAEFMAFTPHDFVEEVVLDGRSLRIAARGHIVQVDVSCTNSPRDSL